MLLFVQLSREDQQAVINEINAKLLLINECLSEIKLDLSHVEGTRYLLQGLQQKLRETKEMRDQACLKLIYETLMLLAEYWPLNVRKHKGLVCPINRSVIHADVMWVAVSNGYLYSLNDLKEWLRNKKYFPDTLPGSDKELCTHDIETINDIPQKNQIFLGVAKGLSSSGAIVFLLSAVCNLSGISLISALSGVLMVAGLATGVAIALSVGIIFAPVLAAMLIGGVTAWYKFAKHYPNQFASSNQAANEVKNTSASTAGCFAALKVCFKKNQNKQEEGSGLVIQGEKKSEQLVCLDKKRPKNKILRI